MKGAGGEPGGREHFWVKERSSRRGPTAPTHCSARPVASRVAAGIPNQCHSPQGHLARRGSLPTQAWCSSAPNCEVLEGGTCAPRSLPAQSLSRTGRGRSVWKTSALLRGPAAPGQGGREGVRRSSPLPEAEDQGEKGDPS